MTTNPGTERDHDILFTSREGDVKSPEFYLARRHRVTGKSYAPTAYGRRMLMTIDGVPSDVCFNLSDAERRMSGGDTHHYAYTLWGSRLPEGVDVGAVVRAVADDLSYFGEVVVIDGAGRVLGEQGGRHYSDGASNWRQVIGLDTAIDLRPSSSMTD